MQLHKGNLCWVKTIGTVSLYMACFILPLGLSAQWVVRGKVTDSATGYGLPGVTVAFEKMSHATSTDSLGHYELRANKLPAQIRFQLLGYHPAYRVLSTDSTQTVNVTLEEDAQVIDEVLVRGGRYRNRDNPAVALIRKVIEYKAVNTLERFDYRTYDVYEKIMMAASDVPQSLVNSPLTQNYRFAFENIDSTLVPGRPLLPLFLEENMARQYERRAPRSSKRVTVATKKTELDKRYVNNENIQTYIKYLHNDVDIYAGNMIILNRPFLGPLAETSPLFYRFYITDTVRTPVGEFIEVSFVPRNEKDALFSGKLHISTDGNYGVRYADIRIDGSANINWVNDIQIMLRFTRHRSGIYVLQSSDARYNFGLYDSKRGLFGQRTVFYTDLDTETPIPNQVFSGQGQEQVDEAPHRPERYWVDRRPVPLSAAEARTYTNLDSLNRNRSFRRALDLGYLLMTSYKQAGPFEIGPVEYTYTYNQLEGSRVRVGGRSSRALSERFYMQGYAAYGFGDKRWKYYVGAAHTLNGRRINEYPAHYIHVSYQDDAREPGLSRDFYNGGSFAESFRSGNQDKWTYYRELTVDHVFEFGNHLMLTTTLSRLHQAAAAQLRFVSHAGDSERPFLRTAILGTRLRWAPGEEYRQRNLERTPIINGKPVFTLGYQHAIKGFLGGEYTYQKFSLDAFKRIFLSQLGHADFSFGAGYISDGVPFPLLDIPNSNQSYVLAPDSYQFMNDLEFVSDQYVKLSVNQHFLGFFLNKIPGIRSLKLREVATVKALYGGLRPGNRPENNPNLFSFPTDVDGNPTTFTLEHKPYLEASVGLENIFSVLRVEYVRRLSYLHHPDTRRGGFRFSIGLTF